MNSLLAISRTELVLFTRRRGTWVGGGIMLLFGMWVPASLRASPLGAWNTLSAGAFVLTLLLAFLTGDQISQDQDHHLANVLLSTPITTPAYVWGKYLAGVIGVLGLATLYLVAALSMDRVNEWHDPPILLGHSAYPPLGAGPYLLIWGLMIVVPLLFGSALTLAGMTVLRGQRILAYASLIVLWLGPPSLRAWPNFLDITAASLSRGLPFPGSAKAFALMTNWPSPAPPTPDAAQQIVSLVQGDFGQTFPAFFWWSRGISLGITLLLVGLTSVVVQRQRRSI